MPRRSNTVHHNERLGARLDALREAGLILEWSLDERYGPRRERLRSWWIVRTPTGAWELSRSEVQLVLALFAK